MSDTPKTDTEDAVGSTDLLSVASLNEGEVTALIHHHLAIAEERDRLAEAMREKSPKGSSKMRRLANQTRARLKFWRHVYNNQFPR